MVSVTQIPPGEHIPTADHRVTLHDVSWSLYLRLLAERGERSSPRMTYLDGELEIMSPSRGHESTKSFIGRLIEIWALETGTILSPYGAWTLKRKPRQGAEPDECYIIGDQNKKRPDLAIEVIWTHGGLDKLEIYQAFDVPEVWVWHGGAIAIHVLGKKGYARKRTSAVLPELDVGLLARFLDRPTVVEAMRDFRDALRKTKPRAKKKR